MCWALGGIVEGKQIVSLAPGWWNRRIKGACVTTEQRDRAHRRRFGHGMGQRKQKPDRERESSGGDGQ